MPKLPPPRPKSPSGTTFPEVPPAPDERRSSGKLPAVESLDEVERALSILQGRHPDAVRTERKTTDALAAKKAAAEAQAARYSAEDKQRLLVRGAIGAVVLVVVVVGWVQYSHRAGRAKAVEGALREAVAGYVAHGFTRVAPSRFAVDEVALDVADATCFVALASRSPGDGALSVDRSGAMLEGTDSIAWCSCGPEQSTVRLRDPRAGGLIVLSIPATEVGGDHGLSFVEPLPHMIAQPNECNHAALDTWIGKGSAVRAKDGALDEELRTSLAREGFSVVASAPPALPFAVVPGVADTCALVVSTVADDVLSLRLPGGDRPVSDVKPPFGFCASHAESVTVWHKGKGEVVVERVAATRVGGTHGLHDVTPKLGMPALNAWVPEDDVTWDATATLRATGIVPAELTVTTDGSVVKTARLVAISSAGAIVKADTAVNTTYLCDPPLTDTLRTAICLQSIPLSWHAVGEVGKAGIVESTLPFWMQTVLDATDPAALAQQLALVKLGLRLAADGFEATTLDGVTEIEGGAVVNGRGGSDAVVAVQLTGDRPWASPCSTGETWTVEGEPAVVSLAAGAQVTVSCMPRPPKKAQRRTVVFRHALPPRRAP